MISVSRDDDDDGGHNVHLPRDIIFYHILTRIPSHKDLNRFRCVCKLWSKLFDDPLFMSLYKTRRTSGPPRGLITLERDYYFHKKRDYYIHSKEEETTTYNFSYFDFDKKEEQLIPFQLPDEGDLDSGYIWIEHSLNGLLLMNFRFKYYVYNLVTATWSYMGAGDNILVHNVYLAHDPVKSEYKVVRYCDRKFSILSDMNWRYVYTMPDRLKDFEIDIRCRPATVNYSLHWICRKSEYGSKEYHGELLKLDVSTEKMSAIKLPIEVVLSKYCGLLEMEGLLWVFRYVSKQNSVQLWYLKKKKTGYGDEEWVVMWNFNLMTEISLQQLKTSNCISARSQSSPVLLKSRYWSSCPFFFVMDPKCKILFTDTIHEPKHVHKYVCSYDIELNQGRLVYARQMDQRMSYWFLISKSINIITIGNNSVLSTE